jgi:1,4-dihydroxy-2-naphthoyl-CoA hydrolase
MRAARVALRLPDRGTRLDPMSAADDFNQRGQGFLPGHLGIEIVAFDGTEVRAQMAVHRHLMAPNGYLHAGAVVSLADTCCGYGCVRNLPEGGSGFTTVELKSNHLGTAREGMVDCIARAVHLGRTTQVWDATVTHRESGRTIALFRCTQMVLRASAGG